MSLLDKVVDLVNTFNNLANRTNHMFDDLKAKINSVTLAIDEVDEKLKMEIAQRSNETNFLKSFAERNLALNENLQLAINTTLRNNSLLQQILANKLSKNTTLNSNESNEVNVVYEILKENLKTLFNYTELTANFTQKSFTIPYEASSNLLFLVRSDSGGRINYRSDNFETEAGHDYMLVVDGNELMMFTAKSPTLTSGLTSKTSSLLFYFHSDHDTVKNPIKIEYKEV
ncbi:hypothetical protein B4U79_16897 [Dinothrombium tinctorium]|uniref:Uncharacterized protein n=1 Tax=Dinothrombium tinctorium TaxID=1965070 RepID=A0A3S3ND05_9ACAR|nr:hypothetical protein B4U79_16897 [Dinothrombium tinctorium]